MARIACVRSREYARLASTSLLIGTKGNAGLLLAGDKKMVFSTLAEKSEKQRLDP
jgi:hypothetical protein